MAHRKDGSAKPAEAEALTEPSAPVPRPGPSPRRRDDLEAARMRARAAAGAQKMSTVVQLEQQIAELRRDGHAVTLDGKRLPAVRATQVMAETLTAGGRELTRAFCQALEDARRTSQARKDAWANPKTNPAALGTAEDHWVHFVLNIASGKHTVDPPQWVRCKERDCPENKFSGK